MTAEQFRAALAKLKMSQTEFSRRAKVDARTVRRWASGECPVPGYAETILVLLEIVDAEITKRCAD